MRTQITPRALQYQFDSLAEFGRFIADTPRKWRERSSEGNAPEKSWDLNAGYKGALDLASKGWIEGAQRAQRALKGFNANTPRPQIRNDFYGHMPNVPRHCAGAPDSMMRHTPVATMGGGRVLTLYVPVTISCFVDAECAANFGVGVAQYVRQMETQGIRCEVHAVACLAGYETNQRLTYALKVKSAAQPLDLAVLAFAIGHPAMFRRLGFAFMERSEAREMEAYGYPKDLTLADLINPPRGSAILNGMRDANDVAKTPAAALEWIEKQIEAAMKGKAA
jgi:hypothetical protein